MKRMILFLAGLLLLSGSFAAVNISYPPHLKASEILFPVGKTGKTISLLDLSQISIKDLQLLTGHKMDFFDRLTFRSAQKKVRNMIGRDGTVNSKRLDKYSKRYSGETGFHGGGFALGFFLGVIGVVIAYVIHDDYKRNRVKWAWIGWGVWLAIWITLLLTIDWNQFE